MTKGTYIRTPEIRDKIRQSLVGRKLSLEHRAKLSLKTISNDHKARLLAGNIRRHELVSIDARFARFVMPEPMSGCHLWIGALDSVGYGTFKLHGKSSIAHGYADDRVRGPLPSGLERDHLCGVRSCVNAAHIERVTHSENVRRAFERKAALR